MKTWGRLMVIISASHGILSPVSMAVWLCPVSWRQSLYRMRASRIWRRFSCFRHWDTQIRKFSEAYLLISKQLTFCPQKSDENRAENILWILCRNFVLPLRKECLCWVSMMPQIHCIFFMFVGLLCYCKDTLFLIIIGFLLACLLFFLYFCIIETLNWYFCDETVLYCRGLCDPVELLRVGRHA